MSAEFATRSIFAVRRRSQIERCDLRRQRSPKIPLSPLPTLLSFLSNVRLGITRSIARAVNYFSVWRNARAHQCNPQQVFHSAIHYSAERGTFPLRKQSRRRYKVDLSSCFGIPSLTIHSCNNHSPVLSTSLSMKHDIPVNDQKYVVVRYNLNPSIALRVFTPKNFEKVGGRRSVPTNM